MMDSNRPVVVIGAGLAGLNCARILREAGVETLLLESADRVGGRVATDTVDGFTLDRGFQVFLDSYPEARRSLDLNSLGLKPFEPGALIWNESTRSFDPLFDVFRSPRRLLATLRSPAATLRDKLLTLKLRGALAAKSVDEILDSPQTSTIERLKTFGFSSGVIESFFRPFYAGVFLERELETSSRAFDFTFKMFAAGRACLPANGMASIPKQLASRLPANSIRLNTRVSAISNHVVALEGGESILAAAIVIATDLTTAAKLAPDLVKPTTKWNSTTALHFATPADAFCDRALRLVPGDGVVNLVSPQSAVAAEYAPAGAGLACVSCVGLRSEDDATLGRMVRDELTRIFGDGVGAWRLLRVDRIERALPDQRPAALARVVRPARLRERLFIAGDGCDLPSINGALASGRRAAQAVLRELGVGDDAN